MSSSTAPQRGTATARTLSVLSRPVPEFGGETARSLFDRQAGDSPAAATGTLNTRTAGKVAAEPARHGTSAGEQERCPGNGSGKRASADGAPRYRGSDFAVWTGGSRNKKGPTPRRERQSRRA